MKNLFYLLIIALLVALITTYRHRTAEANFADIPLLISETAEKYGINSDVMLATLTCESGLRPNAIGDHNTSFGIAQIHLPAHPDISKAEAFDPYFSINFMAKEMSKGHSWKWTCFKIHFKPGDEYSYPQVPLIYSKPSVILYIERGRTLPA